MPSRTTPRSVEIAICLESGEKIAPQAAIANGVPIWVREPTSINRNVLSNPLADELGWVNGSGTRIITGCVAHPTAGAMGYHYFNEQLMDDLAVDPLEPEVLVYAPGPQGRLRLVAVEWVARGPRTDPPGVTEPPSVLGMPMHILNPAVGFYLMHAWLWKPNPAGMFADWNPDVSCP